MNNEDNIKQPFSPLSFIDKDNIEYREILDFHIPNVLPGQYVSKYGIIYDINSNKFRFPINSSTYITICVKFKNGDRYNIGVHRLIMLVFSDYLPKNFKRMVVNHKDGIKHHNDMDNLELMTYSENTIHAYKMGLNPTGEDHHCARLKNYQVEEICKELEKPRYYGQIADLTKKYNIAETTIRGIADGKLWTSISKKYNIDFDAVGVDSILTKDQVKEICEELSKGRYHGQCVDLGNKYNVSPSTIKEIVQRRSWFNISKDYEFPSSINTNLSETIIHEICKIIEEYGYCDINVKKDIANRLNLEYTDKLRHNIGRLFRREKGCYYNITSQYNW